MLQRVRTLLERRAQPLPTRYRLPLLIIAAVALTVAMVWAWNRAELTIDDLSWEPLAALALVAAPASLLLKAAEFVVAARIAGQRPGLRLAMETAVVSSAANLLPLPGSLLVTVKTLADGGTGYGGAVAANAVPGMAWLGITGMVGGSALVVEGATAVGLIALVGGVVALVGAGAVFRSTGPSDGRPALVLAILLVETGWLAVSGLRFTLAAAVIGVDLALPQALALSVASAITVAIGFFPGGLGVREALIAALSPLIGLDLETGVLLGAVDQMVWLGFLALAGVGLTVNRRRTSVVSPS
ncbi:MAG TPA: hypothetical protein DCE75_11005 [Acidimicrobiaceae bacterium]|jgi:hypothetical protein|nr:hypothetical protein [Acidimicrobiaceae bacterium]